MVHGEEVGSEMQEADGQWGGNQNSSVVLDHVVCETAVERMLVRELVVDHIITTLVQKWLINNG